jgi:hypothetical protein
MKSEEYIEKYILPDASDNEYRQYKEGIMGYDDDYIKEHASYNNIEIEE